MTMIQVAALLSVLGSCSACWVKQLDIGAAARHVLSVLEAGNPEMANLPVSLDDI
jgi:hypothetical protein